MKYWREHMNISCLNYIFDNNKVQLNGDGN